MRRATPVANGMKVCTVCGELKNVEEDFYAHRGRFAAQCRACRSEYVKKRYIVNKEAISAYKKAWWLARKAKRRS